MSERDQNTSGGWHTPKAEQLWRTPDKPKTTEGWRKPTLPANMTEEPRQAGDWHLPRPEDTLLEATAEDDVSPAAPAATTGGAGVDLSASPEDLSLYLTAERATSDLPTLDDGDDFSMSEMIALASLAEQTSNVATPVESSPIVLPSAPAPQQTSTTVDPAALSPAERAVLGLTTAQPTAPGGLTAEEYARQQLAMLGDDDAPAAPAAPSAAATAPGGLTAEEYARQQLAMLGGDDEFTQPGQSTGFGTAAVVPPGPAAAVPPAAAAPAPLALTPQQQSLAQQYHNTENQVRALRAQWANGAITREQLEEQMRALMVRDENNVYWMMGVDNDIWYKFVDEQWQIDTPPVLILEARASDQPGTIGPMTQASIPYITEGAAPAQYQPTDYGSEEGLRVDENFMPLPRRVPSVDPESTVPATGGVYLANQQPGLTVPSSGVGVTMPAANTPYSQPTVPSAVNFGGEPYAEAPNFIASPIDTAEEDAAFEAASEIEKANKRAGDRLRTTILVVVAAVIGIPLAVGIVVIAVLLLTYGQIASEWRDEVEALANYQPQFQTARIYAADGTLLAELSGENEGLRTPVTLDRVSPYMIHAVVSTENDTFFVDAGYDLFAIARAFLQNFFAGEIESGASTITMQIARTLVVNDSASTAERKIIEMVVAAEIARRYPKDFILELYLNEFNYGNQSFGVEEAAQFYFDVPASDLNFAQSAMLAGLLNAPATYDPVTRRQDAFFRMRVVMDAMERVRCLPIDVAAWNAAAPQPAAGEDFCVPDNLLQSDDDGNRIGPTAVQIANVEAASYTPRDSNVDYPHFVQFVQAQLEQNFGPQEIYRRGFTVRTTLVPSLQDAAQDALVATLAANTRTGLNTGAVMVVDPNTGAILAMVGSPDFNNADIAGQVNNVLTWQQPGSAIKPITYMTALEGVGDRNGNGVLDPSEYLTPASILWDVPTVYPALGNYAPSNFDGRFRGPVALRLALAQSLNVPSVKLFEFIGADAFLNMAARLGLNFLPDTQITLASGVGATDVRLYDMMRAYAAIANGGTNRSLYAIDSITDASGAAVPYTRVEPTQAVAANTAYVMQNILSDDAARAPQFGANSVLTIQGQPTQGVVGAKTGTTDGNRDLWTMGFTTNRVVGVWLGRPDNQPTTADSLTTAAVVWNAVMRAALTGNAPQAFRDPGNGSVIPARICADTGAQAGGNCTNVRNEIFTADRQPPPADSALVSSVAIDTWTGLRANQFCPDNVQNVVVAAINDQAAIAWINSTAEGRAWASRVGLTPPLQTAPAASAQCDMTTVIPVVRLTSPTDGQTVIGTVDILGVVSAADFRSYQIEVASVANPTSFQIVVQPTNQQQPNPNSVLGRWNSTTVPNGEYIIRLAVFANNANNGYIFRTARVIVNNPTPTATATPQVIPTAGIPFDPLATPLGGFSAGSAPTPTATINPGG